MHRLGEGRESQVLREPLVRLRARAEADSAVRRVAIRHGDTADSLKKELIFVYQISSRSIFFKAMSSREDRLGGDEYPGADSFPFSSGFTYL